MAFTSQLMRLEPVVSDETLSVVTDPTAGFARGLDLGLRGPEEYAYGDVAAAFTDDLLIPRNEWQARIAEMEERKSRLSDFCTLVGMPSLNQEQTNYCFPAGTLIRMADGTHKAIEDVKLRDKVLTAEGNIGAVRQTNVRSVSEPLVMLKLWGHSHLRATSEHPVLTKRGYVPIGKLKIGDKVAIPKYAPCETTLIQTDDLLFEKTFGQQAKRVVRKYVKSKGSTFVSGLPGRRQVKTTRHPVPDLIQMSAGFGRIIGFYLAEGHTCPSSVRFSFNATEQHTFAAELVTLCKDVLGVDAHSCVRQSVCQVTIYGARWAQLFDALCGRGSGGKQLHSLLTSAPLDCLERILSGWMDGDRSSGEAAVTVSRRLALGMFDIANRLGRMPCLSTHTKSKLGADGIWRKHAWQVSWADKGNVNHATEQDEKHLWRTVRGIECEDFTGDVFNFSVEGDNSYVAEGIGVHNCWANAPVYATQVVRSQQNQGLVLLSPASVAAQIKNYKNVGGWGREALEWIVERGIVPVSQWPANAIDRRYATPANLALAMQYRVDEWTELKPRSLDQLVSLLLRRIPVPVGYSWWAHQVTAIDALWLDGEIAIRIRNSWGNWGENGYGVLKGSRLLPDDAVAPRTALATN